MKIVDLGLTDYRVTYQAMREFTHKRTTTTEDELWLLEHLPVYSQGKKSAGYHTPNNTIPLVNVDRGGQMTYHGPGQLIAYLLIDLKRRQLGIKAMVRHIENSIIHLLAEYGIIAEADPDAPGVYVKGKKIASLGLKVSNGACYHGVSLNVDMDLQPFDDITPCGQVDMVMVDMKQYAPAVLMTTVKQQFSQHFIAQLTQ